jgi:hypothetical protein
MLAAKFYPRSAHMVLSSHIPATGLEIRIHSLRDLDLSKIMELTF